MSLESDARQRKKTPFGGRLVPPLTPADIAMRDNVAGLELLVIDDHGRTPLPLPPDTPHICIKRFGGIARVGAVAGDKLLDQPL